jgi:hypothetical protein
VKRDMGKIDRRDFLKLMGAVGLTAVSPWPLSGAHAQEAGSYDGPLIVTLAASGGWDPTSFCDPKENVPGEREITGWSRTLSTGTIAGSPVLYAPFANNQQFFEQFAAYMLVINGIDTQTNSHDTGVRFNWSGRIPMGYPAFAAIAGAVFGGDMPLPFLTNGSYRETAGLVTYTEVNSTRDLQDLVNVNRVPRRDRSYHEDDELALIEDFQQQRLARQMSSNRLLPRQRRALENLIYARNSRDDLASLLVNLPNQLDDIDLDGQRNSLLPQAQMALICMQAGLSVSADLSTGGFDTHTNHDASHAPSLRRLTNGVTYLWETAEAMGIADRLYVLIGSDFGRTPFYNNSNGKDHWPVGSAILMKKGVPWTNRVVGLSDEGHDALGVDADTPDTAGTAQITCAHVQDALRRACGIADHQITRQFPLDATFVNFFDDTTI